jgi:hypothetical protein
MMDARSSAYCGARGGKTTFQYGGSRLMKASFPGSIQHRIRAWFAWLGIFASFE